MIEPKLNKSIYWLICQLHANELPICHLFQTLNGKTTGPKGYSGNIGKMLEGCKKLDVFNFKLVFFDLLDMSQIDLSTDQQYLYDIHQSLSAGKLNENLANKNPGKMAHSRWLTTANRILRLYVSTVEPSQTLKIIVKYITKVHAPVWFAIKNTSSSQNGALHLFKTIEQTRMLIPDIRNIDYPVIQRNVTHRTFCIYIATCKLWKDV